MTFMIFFLLVCLEVQMASCVLLIAEVNLEDGYFSCLLRILIVFLGCEIKNFGKFEKKIQNCSVQR